VPLLAQISRHRRRVRRAHVRPAVPHRRVAGDCARRGF
jgi:hypothetical protein